MIRVQLQHVGIGAFVAAMVVSLASCSGGGTSVATSPTVSPTVAPPSLSPIPPTAPPSTNPTPVPTPSPVATGAVANIIFTGSFQYGPFEIDQYSNGVAVLTQSSSQLNIRVPRTLVDTFYSQLRTMLPVDKIPVGVCPKPTVAPTDQTTITFQQETSGDISCFSGHENTKHLFEDVVQIENFLNVRSMLRTRQ
jgi:hypothetical protein